ncbi:MAG: IS4 family transposase, partial [Dehalococcoidia bacterium]|nr:IS4 family transposase [Dehalococcoidia bacterium]
FGQAFVILFATGCRFAASLIEGERLMFLNAVVSPSLPTAAILLPRVSAAQSRTVEAKVLVEPLRTADVKKLLPANGWAVLNYGGLNLGDERLNERAVRMVAKIAEHPGFSLPKQMEGHKELMAAYAFLNNEAVTLEALLEPHRRATLTAASNHELVLMVEDSTELDLTAHSKMTGLGPIGDGKGRGLILHSTLAVVPENRVILGLAHAQVVLRQPQPKKNCHWAESPEAKVWEESVRKVGAASDGSTFIHVSDRGSDIFGYMAACRDYGKHFVVRAFHDRVLLWDDGSTEAEDEVAHTLKKFVRSLDPQPGVGYTVEVHAHNKKEVARQARVVLQWTKVTIPPPAQGPRELRSHTPIDVSLLRVWEQEPPSGAQRVEWILISSLPIETIEDAYRTVDWYKCRWLCEDYHQALKTGCRIEHSQLDDGADIERLVGFLAPVAVRLLQTRQAAHHTPDVPATTIVEPLMVTMLARKQGKKKVTMTMREFFAGVAALGGHQGRRSDGPPGWRTLWLGWQQLSDLTEGARLILGE